MTLWMRRSVTFIGMAALLVGCQDSNTNGSADAADVGDAHSGDELVQE